MTVMDAINKETNRLVYDTYIEYRTFSPHYEESIFTGCCYINKAGEVNSIDGDIYSPNDEIINYEIFYNNGIPCLTVFYESEWL